MSFRNVQEPLTIEQFQAVCERTIKLFRRPPPQAREDYERLLLNAQEVVQSAGVIARKLGNLDLYQQSLYPRANLHDVVWFLGQCVAWCERERLKKSESRETRHVRLDNSNRHRAKAHCQGGRSVPLGDSLRALGDLGGKIAQAEIRYYHPKAGDWTAKERQEVREIRIKQGAECGKLGNAVIVAARSTDYAKDVDARVRSFCRICDALKNRPQQVSRQEFDRLVDALHGERDELLILAAQVDEYHREKDLPDQTSLEDRWITLADAERAVHINRGTISRAVLSGALASNGKKGHARRIDKADLFRWKLERSTKREPNESDDHVQRLVRKHVRD
jgi:hypothetical protein